MIYSTLKRLAKLDLIASGWPLALARVKLALFRNSARIQGKRNQIRMASVRANSHLQMNILGDDNELVLNGELRHVSINVEGSNNRIVVNAGSFLTWTELTILANDSEITVGLNAIVRGKPSHPNVLLTRGEPSRIVIGDGCICSYGIEMRTSDSHPILNAQNERINLSSDIVLEDHVWIGTRCMVLKGAYIGSGSILAASSVLTRRRIGGNMIAAGIPARVIREGIRWER